LLAASDNNLPFPNAMFETTIHYADGANTDGEVQEVHTGLAGFIEFASWGYQSRPDLAVYRHEAHDPGCCSGRAFVYEFYVELDPQKEVSDVTIWAPQSSHTAYVYAATIEP
jgi:hypothetical protein